MPHIRILAIGKNKTDYLREGLEDYLKKIKCFTRIELVEIKSKSGEIQQRKKRETEAVLERLSSNEFCYILAQQGKQMTSEVFASCIQKQLMCNSLCFVIGGAYGLDIDMLKKYQHISLSSMTLTHQMIRLFLVEQIYRAFQIIEGTSYHHSD